MCTLWDFAKGICFQEAICQYTSQILKFTIYFKLFTQKKNLQNKSREMFVKLYAKVVHL